MIIMAEMENDFIIDRTKRTITDSEFGKIGIGAATLNEDLIGVFFDVESVPNDLQRQIDKAIQEEAIKQYYEYEEIYRSRGITPENLKMRETVKVICFDLNLGCMCSEFFVSAIDTIAKILQVDITFAANVEEFHEELKNIIMNAIEERYFG